MRLVVAGGGTGGHLFPGIAVAEEFVARDKGNEVLFIGTENGIEARVLPKLGYRLELISATGMRRKTVLQQLKGVGCLLKSYVQSRRIIADFQPDFVLGVGGYASGPVVLAAAKSHCRRFIHEQNALPGFTNKLLSCVAEKIFVSLEEAIRFFPPGKSIMTGNPLRRQIVQEACVSPAEPKTSNEFRILVFGGSAGAHSINMAMIEASTFLGEAGSRFFITHQTGQKDVDKVKEGYRQAGINAEVLPFIDNMAEAYECADLVICRAGATTIAEVTACGKACIFIPFPYATDDHQRKNAEALVEKGAGFMLLNRDLSGERLAQMILDLIDNRETLIAAGRCARSLAKPDAAKIIVDQMLAA